MKKNIPLISNILCIIFWTNVTFGQNQTDFEKIFLKETEGKTNSYELENFKNITRISFYPDTLPQWFYNPPISNSNEIYAIGISDPDLTLDEATNQALFRAKTMAILFNKSKFQYFKDIYTTEQSDGSSQQYRQRYDTYFKISALANHNSNCFNIIDQHFTRYNEAVVLIRFQPNTVDVTTSTSNEQFSAVGTVIFIEAQIDEAFEPQAEYELISALKMPGDQLLTSQFTFISKGNEFLCKSEFIGNRIDFPHYPYKYTSATWPQDSQPILTYTGLWSIITQKLLKQLMQGIENSSVKTRSVGQQYNPEISNLTREVAIKNAKIILNGIEFGGDDIDFKLYINDL